MTNDVARIYRLIYSSIGAGLGTFVAIILLRVLITLGASLEDVYYRYSYILMIAAAVWIAACCLAKLKVDKSQSTED